MAAVSERDLRRSWPGALVFAAALAIYIRTLCPTVFVEGTGENLICVHALGVPHPPGFPFFCLIGKLFAILVRVGTPAYQVNLFAAVMGAVAAAGLYFLLVSRGAARLAAAAAALTFAFSRTFWREATIAEVYTLSLVLIVIQIALLLRWRRVTVSASSSSTLPPGKRGRKATSRSSASASPADRILLWLGLTFGLGLAVHYEHLLLAPAYFYFVLVHDRGVLRRWRTLAAVALASILGFGLHLYAPLRSLANPPIDWGNPENLANWWHYLTAEQYRGRMFQMPAAHVLANLRAFLANLPVEFSWLGVLSALAGVVALFRRDRALLWASMAVVVVITFWAVNYDIPWEIEVYYLPPLLVMSAWVGVGLSELAGWLARRGRLGWMAPAVLVVPMLVLALNFGPNDLSRQRFVLDNALDILDLVEPDAALILPTTNPTFALIYLSQIEEDAAELRLWSRVEGGITPVRDAVRPPHERRPKPEPRFVADALAEGTPVYAIDRQSADSLPGFAQIAWGCLYRIVPAAAAEEWLRRAPDALSHPYRFDVDGQQLAYGAEQRLIVCRYLLSQGDWAWEKADVALADRFYEKALGLGEGLPSVPAQIGQRYAEQGRTQLAIRVYERALEEHEDAVLHNRLGAVYGRENRLEQAEQHLRRAIALKPDCADAHANLASVYGRRGQLEDAVEELESALSYDPYNVLALKNLAFAYLQIGRREDARKLLERALEVSPEQPEVRQQMRHLWGK